MHALGEQGQTNLAARTRMRKDTHRVGTSLVLDEVCHGKVLSIEVGLAPVVLTLASAVRCVGCVIEGVVASTLGQASLTITASVPAQLQFVGAGQVTAGVETIVGAPLVLSNIATGTRFYATSSGTRWHVVVHNPSIRPSLRVRNITSSTTLGPADADSMLAITIGNAVLTLTLPAANTMQGALLRGAVVASTGQSLVVACAVPGQFLGNLVVRGTNLGNTIRILEGDLVLDGITTGSTFELASTGQNWHVAVRGTMVPG